ncbi:hypothetical protein Nepgr_028563 [Nepenthes gracilis]|uniref:DUF7356 domain-containing protein n=1 Tax=Nepenthes gracilis TaxID=150966 RepID=A0AAD3TAK6_NEPGR|nr:hypothetical protein Nepgr_028563 [Nepenthes gracilis]
MTISQSMKLSYILLGALFLLLYIECANADSEVKGTPNLDPKNLTASIGENVVIVAPVKKEKERTGKSDDAVHDDLEKTNSSKPSVLKDDQFRQEKADDKEGKLGEGLDSQRRPKEEGNEGSLGSSMMPHGKARSQVEECDSSIMCIDEQSNLVACLRVPGNDSPELSLLIQNKGKRPLTVTIMAPDFVQLEKTKVSLQAKEDKKVKVSIGYEGLDRLITLTTDVGHCSLDFRDLISQNPRMETGNSYKFIYLNYLTRTHYVVVISVTAFILLASASIYVGFRRKYFLRNGYQAVDMELPVSSSVNAESKTNDGWENNWDDKWDDEEAPNALTMPVTPSLSSRGLAPRRLNKEGWKD